jgi:hypothetical protein
MTIQELEILNSKSFVKGGLTFDSPEKLLTPVLSTQKDENDFILTASHPTEMAEEQENDQLIKLTSYGRLMLIKKYNIDDEMTYNVGFLVCLDYSKPFIKVFSGVNVTACTNLCIFNASDVEKYELLNNDRDKSYIKVAEYFDNAERKIEQAKNIITSMKNTIYTKQETKTALGQLLWNFCAVKNIAGKTAILNAAELLSNPKNSRYYFEEEQTAWNFYNALTDGYRDKTHLIDQPEKVLSLFKEIQKLKPLSNQLTIN